MDDYHCHFLFYTSKSGENDGKETCVRRLLWEEREKGDKYFSCGAMYEFPSLLHQKLMGRWAVCFEISL